MKNIIYPYSVIIENARVVIVRDYFMSKTIRLDEIQRLEIGNGFLVTQSFLMIDNTKVKFNANYISNKNIELLKTEFKNKYRNMGDRLLVFYKESPPL